MSEFPLPAGCLTPNVVRVGDTVRRPAKPSSPFVAQLLNYLETKDARWAPRFMGSDELGRDTLTYIPGWVPQKWQRFTDQQVKDAACVLRKLHDSTRASKLADGRSVICHHDPGPNNFVFNGARPIALIDFDMAAPGEPLEDVGYLAWSWCISSRLDRQPIHDQARQVRLLVDEYGLNSADRCAVVAAILERQSRNILFWSAVLGSGEDIPTTKHKIVERIDWSRRELAYTAANREAISLALT